MRGRTQHTIALASLTNNCPAPGTPGGPSAAASQSRTVGGQSGVVVRLRNERVPTHTAAGLLGLVLAAQLAVALRRRSGQARA